MAHDTPDLLVIEAERRIQPGLGGFDTAFAEVHLFDIDIRSAETHGHARHPAGSAVVKQIAGISKII